ncbi:GNAT family N-acetyltransferase [Gracilibacillus kekensis]|uniref:Ribosomal-protein-serine acetyltransferase n=1 Tax=Gracilibacillus kekensis TaxID=1027249 RepID=A0A1M7IUC4_9BACI|nr:GNAT family protein [Gracilibacillus kekensis]SHM44305.1 ribosomal-protein-serine acetyltransferase [Gracilibacillus kekensis]
MFQHKIDEEVALKLIDLKDAEAVFKLTDQSREYLREWLPWVDKTIKVENTEEFIRESLKDYVEGKSLTTFILYQGKLAGAASYNKIDWQNKIVYIGYWLGKDYQGKGIMTRVARGLTEYAFTEMQFNKVVIEAATENKKSRSIPERLGFTEEGCIRQAEWIHDHYVDHIFYGMLADEWKE